MMKKFCAVLLALCVLCSCAMAETVRGDLSSRFESEDAITYEGVEYNPRSRLMTLLVTCIADLDEETVTRFHYLLVFDDNQKLTTKFRFEDNTLFELTAEDGSVQTVALRDIFALNEDRLLGGEQLLAELENLLGVKVDYYVGFDLDGLSTLSGSADDDAQKYNDDATLRARMSEILADVRQRTSREVSKLYGDMGDYLVTNMKSGTAMKAYDKLERYERTETIIPEGMPEELVDEEGAMVTLFRVDVESIREQLVLAFYEPKMW